MREPGINISYTPPEVERPPEILLLSAFLNRAVMDIIHPPTTLRLTDYDTARKWFRRGRLDLKIQLEYVEPFSFAYTVQHLSVDGPRILRRIQPFLDLRYKDWSKRAELLKRYQIYVSPTTQRLVFQFAGQTIDLADPCL